MKLQRRGIHLRRHILEQRDQSPQIHAQGNRHDFKKGYETVLLSQLPDTCQSEYHTAGCHQHRTDEMALKNTCKPYGKQDPVFLLSIEQLV